MSEPTWVKSTFSETGGNNCLEVATVSDRIAIRESAEPDRSISIPTAGLRAFLRGVKAGEFDFGVDRHS
jgi:hypothetical protein